MGGEFWAAIAGAVAGGVISACVSYLLQKQNLNAAKAERAQATLESRQERARSLIYKLTQIYSHAGRLNQHMQQLFVTIENRTPSPRPSQMAQIITPVAASIQITPEEVTLLLPLKMNEQFNNLAMIDERHNNLFELLASFNQMKLEFGELFTPEGMTGEVGHMMLTNDQIKVAMPRMLHMDQTLKTLRDESRMLTRDCGALLTSVGDGFNDTLHVGISITHIEPMPD